MILGHFIGTLGVPVVHRAADQSGKPYPCQQHDCGCRDADECWHGCCCFTAKQKLAWAIKQHVTPPDYLVAEVAAEKKAAKKLCCQTKSHLFEKTIQANPSTFELVISVAARKCRALEQLASSLSACTLPPQCERAIFERQATSSMCACDIFGETCRAAPPDPPPRA